MSKFCDKPHFHPRMLPTSNPYLIFSWFPCGGQPKMEYSAHHLTRYKLLEKSLLSHHVEFLGNFVCGPKCWEKMTQWLWTGQKTSLSASVDRCHRIVYLAPDLLNHRFYSPAFWRHIYTISVKKNDLAFFEFWLWLR